MAVAVLSSTQQRLMPTSPYRARKLLRAGKAEIFSHQPFTIRLTKRADGEVQPVELCMDTGYQYIGISVKSDKHEFFAKENEIYQLLRDEGYTDEEISRAFSLSVSEGNIVAYGEHKYAISPSRIEIVRKYCLLDVIANYGAPISIGNESGCLLVAGFETSWGLPQNEAIRIAQEVFPGLGELWSNVQDAFDDVQWLISRGFVITK